MKSNKKVNKLISFFIVFTPPGPPLSKTIKTIKKKIIVFIIFTSTQKQINKNNK